MTPGLWPAWIWPWIGGGAAVLCEGYFRTHRDVPYLLQWPAIPLTILINYAIFRIITGASSWLAGFVAFSSATLIFRVAATFWLREPVDARTWVALALLMIAKALIR